MRLAPLKFVLLTVLDLCLFMPDPRLLDPASLFLTDESSNVVVLGSDNKAMGMSPLLTFRSWCKLVQDFGLYKNNKELMTEDDFEKISLETC